MRTINTHRLVMGAIVAFIGLTIAPTASNAFANGENCVGAQTATCFPPKPVTTTTTTVPPTTTTPPTTTPPTTAVPTTLAPKPTVTTAAPAPTTLAPKPPVTTAAPVPTTALVPQTTAAIVETTIAATTTVVEVVDPTTTAAPTTTAPESLRAAAITDCDNTDNGSWTDWVIPFFVPLAFLFGFLLGRNKKSEEQDEVAEDEVPTVA